jgi:hypothetical protein
VVSGALVGSEGRSPSSSKGAGRCEENLDASPVCENCEKDILMAGGIKFGFLGTTGLTPGATEG